MTISLLKYIHPRMQTNVFEKTIHHNITCKNKNRTHVYDMLNRM